MNSELHPLEPFLPANARILMLGSFPPKRIRWSMDFFYPNLQNDMWRIVGYLAAGDKSHFLMPGGRKFDKERIEAFCRERGIALYDTAVEVIRLKDNASDNFLQVVREVDLAALLARIPHCRTLVTTGAEGDRYAARRHGLRRTRRGRKRGFRICRTQHAAVAHAVVVEGLSAAGRVEGRILPQSVRR